MHNTSIPIRLQSTKISLAVSRSQCEKNTILVFCKNEFIFVKLENNCSVQRTIDNEVLKCNIIIYNNHIIDRWNKKPRLILFLIFLVIVSFFLFFNLNKNFNYFFSTSMLPFA